MATIRVWDIWVRLSHWLTAALFLVNYWILEEGDQPHEWAGYCLVAIVLGRLAWGFAGPQNARIRQFFPTPRRISHYIKHFHQSHRCATGHNPVGGLMILFLWGMLLLTAFSGWLQTTDRFWGEEWVETLHAISAHSVMIAVAVHIIAVFTMEKWLGQPLVKPMITGYRTQGDPTNHADSH